MVIEKSEKMKKRREVLKGKVNIGSRGNVVNETRKEGWNWDWGVARFIVDYIVDCRGVGNASGQCMSCYSRPPNTYDKL